ncbi:MAG TPA: hypothetical protein VI795_02150 [Patescibacteria group bacterium]|nr:hypothetical protein [Patescibacteria group bacterium]
MERFDPRQNLAITFFEALKRGHPDAWWKNGLYKEPSSWKENEILPSPKRELTGNLEIMGLSEAGKSTGLDFLISNPIPGFRQIYRPELVVDLNGQREDFNLYELKKFLKILEGNPKRMCIWNLVKCTSFIQGLEQIAGLLKQDALNEKLGDPIRMIIERGPNDVIATSLLASQLAAQESGDKKTITRTSGPVVIGEDVYLRSDFNDLFATTFTLGLGSSHLLDAVVIYYISYEEMVKRRLKQGKKAEGDFVNSETWESMDQGYKLWLNYIFPKLREKYGVGLLILNGANQVDQNNIKLRSYCQKVFEMSGY